MAEKILVVSDSHGKNTNLRKVISYFGHKGKELSMLIHLGDCCGCESEIESMVDCPVEIVRGNCDGITGKPIVKLINIGDEVAMITHGHRYNCKSGIELMRDMARENGASIVLYGHTHVPLEDASEDVRVYNPGSISLPRQEGYRPTYLVITLEEDGRKNFTIVQMR